jgi:Protein of unknown function (DUF3016)
MRFSSLIRILLTGSGVVSIAAPAAVVVTFPEAGRYSDAGDPWTANRNIAELKRHLERLGERHLSPSQSLKIEVLDIDLAGRMRFFTHHGLAEIRVLNGRADWPSIRLRYTLESEGKISDAGEETVADMAYLQRPAPGASSEPLYYEKRMLDDWFRARFVERRRRVGAKGASP